MVELIIGLTTLILGLVAIVISLRSIYEIWEFMRGLSKTHI